MDLSYLEGYAENFSLSPGGPVLAITELAHEMKALGEELDELDAVRKTKQQRYDEIRKRLLPEALALAEMSGFKLSGGESVHLRTDTYASVAKEDTAAFHAWLRDNGFASLIVPTVNHQTLRAWAREQRDAGGQIPEMVKVYTEPVAVLRKS